MISAAPLASTMFPAQHSGATLRMRYGIRLLPDFAAGLRALGGGWAEHP